MVDIKYTYYIKTKKFCCGARTKNGKIIKVAPILKWSKGKNILTLINWLKKNFSECEITRTKEL